MWVRSLSEIQPRARSPEGSADGKEKMKGTLIVMGRRRGREEGGKKQEGRRLVEDSSLNSRQIRSRQLMWVRSSKLLVVELKVDRRQATNMCEVVIEGEIAESIRGLRRPRPRGRSPGGEAPGGRSGASLLVTSPLGEIAGARRWVRLPRPGRGGEVASEGVGDKLAPSPN
ncbi:hypothetical protein CRG98_015751 [Punica granatum]|uniref:Uncharacterized protein n=1 Tax=Punica granatum TaxID=22663 RepID=A0A2I0K5P6_PUNGR|nr:hypothetical protein CRG98_015751 [Punica granatum]